MALTLQLIAYIRVSRSAENRDGGRKAEMAEAPAAEDPPAELEGP